MATWLPPGTRTAAGSMACEYMACMLPQAASRERAKTEATEVAVVAVLDIIFKLLKFASGQLLFLGLLASQSQYQA